ncbi:proteolysis 1 [Actinidia rufa]|uniref:Proteolysis 1 n=1 Tax=Actinidia rufa TaxID=165716 RepID=A0A7J0F2W7_9ERIC|nr:proteolysis 1 [Actinidia rufa]
MGIVQPWPPLWGGIWSSGGGHGCGDYGRVGRGGRDIGVSDRGPRKCTDGGLENYPLDYCWDLCGRPIALQVVVVSEEDASLVTPPSTTNQVMSIPEEEYHRLLSAHSSSTATLVQSVLPRLVLLLRTLGLLILGPWLPDSAQSQKDAAQSPSMATNAYLSWLSGQGPKVHIGVGCDYCGMCPIIGERYRCKDCKEKMGFDLCEGCYNSSSKLPGRFNQQHTPEHKLEIVPLDLEHELEFVQSFNLADIVLRFEPVDSEVDDSEVDGSDAPEDMTNVPPHDPEDGSAAPASVDCTLEDQEGTHSTI